MRFIYACMCFICMYVLHMHVCASYMHLILMGWERYVAIAKPMKYKVLVRKRRIKRYSGIVWITVVIVYVLVMTLQAIALPHEFLLVLHLIEGFFRSSAFWRWCIFTVWFIAKHENRANAKSAK